MSRKIGNWFPHYSGARNDNKIIDLIRKYGHAGYGYYFMMLEIIREQKEFKYPISGIGTMAYDIRIDAEVVRDIVENSGLFVVDEFNFFSPQFNANMKPLLEKSERARDAANKRWTEQKAVNAKADAKADANADAIKEKKRKEKKIKEEKIKEENNNIGGKQSLHAVLKSDFLKFYKYKTSIEYYWTAKDGSALKSLIQKLKYFDNGTENIQPLFQHILKSIKDKWILDNLSPTTLNSKFNEILNKIKNDGKSTEISEADIDAYYNTKYGSSN